MRANLADLIFSFKKKDACFLNSWKNGVLAVLMLFKLFFLLNKDLVFDDLDDENEGKE